VGPTHLETVTYVLMKDLYHWVCQLGEIGGEGRVVGGNDLRLTFFSSIDRPRFDILI
jgi:hypothetical protein